MIASHGEPGLELVLAIMRAEEWRRESCEHGAVLRKRFHARVMAAFDAYRRAGVLTVDELAAIGHAAAPRHPSDRQIDRAAERNGRSRQPGGLD